MPLSVEFMESRRDEVLLWFIDEFGNEDLPSEQPWFGLVAVGIRADDYRQRISPDWERQVAVSQRGEWLHRRPLHATTYFRGRRAGSRSKMCNEFFFAQKFFRFCKVTTNLQNASILKYDLINNVLQFLGSDICRADPNPLRGECRPVFIFEKSRRLSHKLVGLLHRLPGQEAVLGFIDKRPEPGMEIADVIGFAIGDRLRRFQRLSRGETCKLKTEGMFSSIFRDEAMAHFANVVCHTSDGLRIGAPIDWRDGALSY